MCIYNSIFLNIVIIICLVSSIIIIFGEFDIYESNGLVIGHAGIFITEYYLNTIL